MFNVSRLRTCPNESSNVQVLQPAQIALRPFPRFMLDPFATAEQLTNELFKLLKFSLFRAEVDILPNIKHLYQDKKFLVRLASCVQLPMIATGKAKCTTYFKILNRLRF